MKKNTKKLFITRIENLIHEGEQEVLLSRQSRLIPFETEEDWQRVDHNKFHGWKVSSLDAIKQTTDKNSSYFEQFEEIVDENLVKNVKGGISILKALLKDVESDYLITFEDLITANIFSDFLEISEELFNKGYKYAAVSISGSVLENELRKICQKEKTKVKKKEDIGSLSGKLADKGFISRPTQKEINAWKNVRDYVDHGNYLDEKRKDEITETDIKKMLEGIVRFISEFSA